MTRRPKFLCWLLRHRLMPGAWQCVRLPYDTTRMCTECSRCGCLYLLDFFDINER